MSIFVCRIIAADSRNGGCIRISLRLPLQSCISHSRKTRTDCVGLMDAAQHESILRFVLTDGGIMQALGRLRIEVFRCAFIWRQKTRQNNLHEAFSISCRESKGKNTP